MSAVLATSSGGQSPGGIEGWLLHFHGPVAYAIVGFLTFAEAGLMVGFFIPGETAVVIGGALAGLHRVNLFVMMAVVVVCAIVGDSSGFEVGRKSGPWILERRALKGRAAVRQTAAMLERYGGPAVFLGRFVAFARAIIPGIAGMSGLRYRTFLFYNACGGLLWGVGYTLLGFVVGVSFGRVLSKVGLWSLAAVAAIALVAITVKVVRSRRERRRVASEFEQRDERDGHTGRGDEAEA
ncbi:MAG: DedA family protein [Acidimicrobiales bacterium]